MAASMRILKGFMQEKLSELQGRVIFQNYLFQGKKNRFQ